MPVRAIDDKPSDTLVVVSGEGFWTGSSTLPHLHQRSLPRVRACAEQSTHPLGVEPGSITASSRQRHR